MNVTQLEMINNSIRLAEHKLTQHKVQGVKSSLNVFQVAQLMDTIKFGDEVKRPQNSSIFYNISAN
jgi:hypothetical protein